MAYSSSDNNGHGDIWAEQAGYGYSTDGSRAPPRSYRRPAHSRQQSGYNSQRACKPPPRPYAGPRPSAQFSGFTGGGRSTRTDTETDWDACDRVRSFHGDDYINRPGQAYISPRHGPPRASQPRGRPPSRRPSYSKPSKHGLPSSLRLRAHQEPASFDCVLQVLETGKKQLAPNKPRLLKASRHAYCLGSPTNRKAVIQQVQKQMHTVIGMYRDEGMRFEPEDQVMIDFIPSGQAACGTSKKSCGDSTCYRRVLIPSRLVPRWNSLQYRPRL